MTIRNITAASFLTLGNSNWIPEDSPQRTAFYISLATFSILAIELTLIRWTSSQIRIMAYFNNIVLISAFLGMGLGLAIGRKRPNLLHWTLPCLLLLSIPLTFSEALGIMHMPFPDSAVSLWGGEINKGDLKQFLVTLMIFMFLFCMHVVVFLSAGAAVGALFHRLKPLRAYTFDLLGSLLGILAFTLLNFANAPPPVWLAVGSFAFVYFSRSLIAVLCFVGIVGLGYISIQGATFSPYNRIDLDTKNPHEIVLSVNRDFHQVMHDLSDERIASIPYPPQLEMVQNIRSIYDIPFVLNANRDQALIVGAGTGNDVQGALRNGYQKVYSNDIDGRIIALGKHLHPEKPYSDSRVTPIINDARAYFQQYEGEPYDLICFGLLDSHAMFSSMTSLRLDNYVYTEEGIRSAYKHVAENGHMTISFSLYAGDWIFERLYWTIAKATGVKPVAVYAEMQYAAIFIVPKPQSVLNFEHLNLFQALEPRLKMENVRTTNDNWPFLYLKPNHFPAGYLTILVLIILIAGVLTYKAFGIKSVSKDFDLVMFFMGAAFMLIETRGVTSLSLLFGSTWVVNSAIFSSILALVLIANLAVERFQLNAIRAWFILLFISVTFLALFDIATLNQFNMVTRGLVGGLITAMPIGFAGIIVSIFLRNSKNPTTSLGSNLLGSVIGGCLEYLSMYTGLSALAWLALIMYLLSLLFLMRRGKTAVAV